MLSMTLSGSIVARLDPGCTYGRPGDLEQRVDTARDHEVRLAMGKYL
jgi:hypothetical protein